MSGISYVILHSDDVFLWEREEDREGNWYYFQRDVAFAVFPSRKSLFDFSDSGRLCHFPHPGPDKAAKEMAMSVVFLNQPTIGILL